MNWATDTALLISHAILLWTVTHYVSIEIDAATEHPRIVTTVRVMTAAIAVLVIGAWPMNLVLATEFAAASALLVFFRKERFKKYSAEIEVSVSTCFIALLWFTSAHYRIPFHGLVALRVQNQTISAVLLLAATFLALLDGANYIVRGVLEKASALPTTGGQTDVTEVRRGRLIGSIERIVLAILIAACSYQAVGFLVAAKGLIRSKEFENRAWAEYFIIGSLMSVLIAIVAGLAIHYLLSILGVDLCSK